MLPASNTFTYVPDIRISEKELMDWSLLLLEHLAWIQPKRDPSFCSVDAEMTGWKSYSTKAMAGFYAIKDLPMENFNGQEVKKKPETLPLNSTDGWWKDFPLNRKK